MSLKEFEIFKKATIDDAVIPIQEAASSKGKYTEAYPIGVKDFDDVFKGGVRDGDMIVIAGRSGAGKTTVMQNFCVNFSNQAFPCIFFSYEISIDNLYAKFLEMGVKDSENLLVFTPKRNTSGNLKWIKEKIQEGMEKYGTKFVFIDHLDYLSPTKFDYHEEQKRLYLQEVCKELKTMAIDLKIMIFVAAHVRKFDFMREIELEDIAESSSIYQLADFVFGVQRKSITEKEGGKKQEVFGQNSILKLLKNRLTGILNRVEFTVANNKMFFDSEPKDISEIDNNKNLKGGQA